MRKTSLRFAVLWAGLVAAAALLGAVADRSLTASGTVARVQASERSITITLADGSEARFVWNADTKISGVLSPGAKVTLRYEVGTDGRNLAQQISVARS
ncbi:MAG TPA: hypothetical protein VN032_12645 [Thermoanaerobaculia bacterium]|jgi:hypothetical protein|nr:hypothetical protein [Thermoanaerobaculia bacterium]